MKKIVLLILLSSFFSNILPAQNDWSDYRGPLKNGHVTASKVPMTWSDSTGLDWRIDVPGQGWSSPIIYKDQIWITTAKADGQELYALCYDLKSGKQIHNILVIQQDSAQPQHPLNSYASPSVAIEKGRVYVHFGAYGTAAIDSKKGKVLWTRTDIHCDHEVGPGSSPILYKNLLIFNMDGTDVQYVIALNKKNGQTVWKRDRGQDFSEKRFDEKKAFYTPIIHQVDGKDQLISPGPHAVMGYDPLSGKEIWLAKFRGFSGSARPLIYNNTLFINTGFGFSSIVAIKLGGRGDLTTSNTLWTNKKSMQARSSPLLIDGLLYMINTGGQAKCIDPKTGEVHHTLKVSGQTSASPIYANKLIYSFDQDGLCSLIKPGKEMELINQWSLGSGMMASPAVVDGAIIVRTKDQLIKITGK